ncbi:MAG: PTS glucose transporter subunit IIA [Roseburia sp.]
MAISDLFKKKEQIDDSLIYAPVTGKVMKLADVQDEVFSSGAMGEGIAIEPSEGKVYAPCNGEVSALFPTGHAIGITAKNGADILIHVGMDTVSLNGEGFKIKTKTGDKVKKGQLLIEFDIDLIKSKGYMITTPVVVTNSNEAAEFNIKSIDTADKDTIILECKFE